MSVRRGGVAELLQNALLSGELLGWPGPVWVWKGVALRGLSEGSDLARDRVDGSWDGGKD